MPKGSDPAVPPVTVILVDDHPVYRATVARGLERSGRVTILGLAQGGEEALDLIRTHDPDVALVDYQMPGLNGLDVVRAVARDHPRTKVLLLSAIADRSVVLRALELGAKGYLSKDARRQEIVDAVTRVSRGDTVVPPEPTGSNSD